ncbi:MAG: phenylalanine--tRNA ligase subunit beta [Phycisphaerae bacterium]|nr:phenylalanine--tRNA ligase subunit beta [Phycisphaerae bacterium]
MRRGATGAGVTLPSRRMLISLAWLNSLLNPGDLTGDEAERVLTAVGFPLESREALPSGDTRLDVEITSNRGDCLSHLGLAREIAAATGRALSLAEATLPGAGAASPAALENRSPHLCPLFTLRVVRGVKVGPSPGWLVRALDAVGQRSINNVVDCTNYVNFLVGNPCHAFDLGRLAGSRLIVRLAREGEALRTLDGKERRLRADELVVADAERAQSLAGVIGGADSEVSSGTTDVALEVATWEPAAVRRAARRLGIRTDASYRFERRVSPHTLDEASRRLAALVIETAGGTLCPGVLAEGRPLPDPVVVRYRPDRCRALLGLSIDDEAQARLLRAHAIEVRPSGGVFECAVPNRRLDLTREIDLVEEVVRTRGLDDVPTHGRMTIEVRPPQPAEAARRHIASILTGLGFFETVTFSFVSPEHAAPFVVPGIDTVAVDTAHRAHEPVLRPSVLPGLLACRKVNQDARVDPPGGVRLFEIASIFGQMPPRAPGRPPETVERRHLALLLDAPGGTSATFDDAQTALRLGRGAIESVVRGVAGASAALEFKPIAPPFPALQPGAFAGVLLAGKPVGYLGLVARKVAGAFGLGATVAGAELNADALLAAYPPRAAPEPLPAFPATEKDLSVIVAEEVTWARIESCVASAGLEHLESASFVTTYRGKQIGAGRKSLTLRMRFRAPDRTLHADDADAQAQRAARALEGAVGARFRTA